MGLLPDIKSSPSIDPHKMTYLIYGVSGIGKTTFCSKLPNALILDTEEGTRLQNVYKVDVPDWETFLKVVDEICTKKHAFKSIVIDTIGRLVSACTKFCCTKFGVDHPSDVAFGKAYDVIKKQFDAPINKLQHSGLGLWFVGHSIVKPIKVAIGDDYDYIEPEIPGFAKRIVLSLCDYCFYATNETQKTIVDGKERHISVRVLKTKPTKTLLAKDRTVNSPLPETLPLDTKEVLDVITKHLTLNSEIAVNG